MTRLRAKQNPFVPKPTHQPQLSAEIVLHESRITDNSLGKNLRLQQEVLHDEVDVLFDLKNLLRKPLSFQLIEAV